MLTALVIVVIVAILAGYGVSLFNKLRRVSLECDEAFAQIDVQLKRRADLIPNLVSTVKGAADFEKTTLQAVTDARTAIHQASSQADTMQADGMLTAALGKLFAVAEAYPQLTATANFQSLQEELAATENKVAFARQHFNDSVRAINTLVATIPTSLVAPIAGVKAREFYELPDTFDRDTPPAVQF